MELTKYKICPDCAKRNPPNLLECRYCEADLTGVKVVDQAAEEAAAAAQAVPASEEAGTELVRVCECGARNAPQARKCAACGEDISDVVPTRQEKTENSAAYELAAQDGTTSFRIDKPVVVIGREAELKDYLEPKVYVSRRHAKLTVAADRVFLENLSRTNGTFLNDREIPDAKPVALSDGDEIGLGGKVVDGSRQEQAAYFIFRGKS